MRIEEIFDNLTDTLKEYANIKAVSIKISLVEKLSLLARDIFSTLIIFLLTAAALIFASMAIMILIARQIGFLYGSLLVCAILTSVAITIYIFRKRLFINMFIARFSRIFFDEDTNNEKDELLKNKQHQRTAQCKERK